MPFTNEEKRILIGRNKKSFKKFTINDWSSISEYKKLSEAFIEKHKDEVDWYYISIYQKLSEAFIEKHKDEVYWNYISRYQKLSEEFIEKHKDKVYWRCIYQYQKLSEEFIEKHKDKVDTKIQKRKHAEKSLKQKRKEVRLYANKHNLQFDGKVLIAFREHDKNGCGVFNKTISYEVGKYYRDWHCDMDADKENSFGFGIWPQGNIKVEVKVEDWGVAVNRDDGKARVWGFKVVG